MNAGHHRRRLRSAECCVLVSVHDTPLPCCERPRPSFRCIETMQPSDAHA